MNAKALRRAFTLIELMIVVVIIGMLMALLIPAVQRAREAGRRTQCSNHCNQVQSALIQYATAKDRLPYLATTLPGAPTAGYVAAGWVPQILAYLGRNDLYQIYNNNAATGGYVANYTGNATGPPGNAFIQYIDTLVCPSDTAKPMTNIALPTNVPTATIASWPASAPLSYAVNAGMPDYTTGSAGPPLDLQENGLFFNQFYALYCNCPAPPTTDLAYVAKNDGTATTILFGENMDSDFWAEYNGTPTATNGPVSFVPFDNYSGTTIPGYEDPQALVWWDLPDQFGLPAGASYVYPGTPAIGLNQGYGGYQPGQLAAIAATLKSGYIARPSSPHPGGFHITFCDGHTMFMSQDVTYQIYAELMTPRGAYARLQYVAGSNPSVPLQTWQTTPISTNSLSP